MRQFAPIGRVASMNKGVAGHLCNGLLVEL